MFCEDAREALDYSAEEWIEEDPRVPLSIWMGCYLFTGKFWKDWL